MRGKSKGKIKQEKVSEVGTYKSVNTILAEITYVPGYVQQCH